MERIVIDQSAVLALQNLDHPAKLCDPSGRTLGYFTPVADPSPYRDVEILIDEEELQRRNGERSFSTAEVLAHLEKL